MITVPEIRLDIEAPPNIVTFTVTNLVPGDMVYIRQIDTGEELFLGRADTNEVSIPAEEHLDVLVRVRNSNSNEPIKPFAITARPWMDTEVPAIRLRDY